MNSDDEYSLSDSDFVICPGCKRKLEEFGDIYNGGKDCGKCKKTVCWDCIGLTACQTNWCICRKCYKWKCRECGKALSKLPPGECYLEDGDPIDVCHKCKEELYDS